MADILLVAREPYDYSSLSKIHLGDRKTHFELEEESREGVPEQEGVLNQCRVHR
jgi:hypothetical protein